jgi:ClpP class serine protease
MRSDRVQIGHSADLMGGLTLPLLGVKIPERNLDEHERVVVKRGILELYDDFTKRVAEGRGIEVGRVREIAEGHVYAGRAALGIRLVDEIASLDRTIEEAKTAAGIPKGRRVRIEEYPKQRLFPMPGLARWVARIAGSGGASADAGDGDGDDPLGGYARGPLRSADVRSRAAESRATAASDASVVPPGRAGGSIARDGPCTASRSRRSICSWAGSSFSWEL